MSLSDLWIADPPALWEAIGFDVVSEGFVVDGVLVHLGGPGSGITAWAIRGVTDTVDGLPTRPAGADPMPSVHVNTVDAIDHVVIVTPDFDRTARVLDAADLPLRRIRDAGAFRQGFRRIGPAILELVEARDAPPGPASFWGITFIASDLDALADRLGDRLHKIKPAVQPGRRIATLDRAAGLSTNVAFMTPEG